MQIGPNVQLLTPTHPTEPDPRRAKWEAAEPIAIGDNGMARGGGVGMPGVTIGENTVVGAGSVVTKDLPLERGRSGQPRARHPVRLKQTLGNHAGVIQPARYAAVVTERAEPRGRSPIGPHPAIGIS